MIVSVLVGTFQRPVKEEKKPIDPFSTGPELFGDILNFGAPRTEKTSKLLFPQPVKPTIGDLRGEPTVIIPAPTTVDPFFVAPSLGLSVGQLSAFSFVIEWLMASRLIDWMVH